MGLFGNIFKPLQGKLTAKQEENMKKVAEVFKEKTGKDYQTAVVWKMTTKKKLTKTVHTYYNWLMGYGIDDNNIPEIVLIPVDPKWDWIDEPIYCKKTNSEMTQDKKTSLFILKNDQLEDGKIDLQLISSVAMMENYLMDVNYMFDYESFNRFLIISLDVLICRYSPLFRAFPALFISEEPHKSFYYPLCFRSQK